MQISTPLLQESMVEQPWKERQSMAGLICCRCFLIVAPRSLGMMGSVSTTELLSLRREMGIMLLQGY
ncbi:hypothetical protein BDW72DRAFT_186433 [Aspergillus terricola var. indicus]